MTARGGLARFPTPVTPRLVLRRFEETDSETIYKIFGDEEVNRFLPWFPLKTLEEVRAFYKSRIEGERCYYAVCLKGGRVIGYVSVSEDNELGYGLLGEYRRRGYATEACAAIIQKLKTDGAPFVFATHDINNPRSGEVMRRLGMKYRYSYQEQWQPKNILVTFRLYQINLDGNDDRVYQKYWNSSDVHFIEEI